MHHDRVKNNKRPTTKKNVQKSVAARDMFSIGTNKIEQHLYLKTVSPHGNPPFYENATNRKCPQSIKTCLAETRLDFSASHVAELYVVHEYEKDVCNCVRYTVYCQDGLSCSWSKSFNLRGSYLNSRSTSTKLWFQGGT